MYGRGREGKLGGEISSSALYGPGCLCRVIKVSTFHIRKGNPSCLKRMYSNITWKDRMLINKWPIHQQVIEITSSKSDCSHISLQRGWVQQACYNWFRPQGLWTRLSIWMAVWSYCTTFSILLSGLTVVTNDHSYVTVRIIGFVIHCSLGDQ